MSQIPVNLSISQPGLQKPAPDSGVLGWSDFLGLAASVGCAIHCAAVPIILSFLPAWGLGWLAHESFHQWMFGICFLIAVIAFVPGIRHHRNRFPMAMGSVGLILIGAAAFVPANFPANCHCGSCSTCSVSPTGNQFALQTFSPTDSLNWPSVALRNGQSLAMNLVQVSSSKTNCEKLEPSLESADNDPPESWWSGFAPWMTPLGGLVLVLAHLFNHHLGTNCRC